MGGVGKKRIFVQDQSSARQNGLPFSPRHRTIRFALVKATKNKANPATDEFAWRTETMVLPEQKVAITEQSQDCQANSKVMHQSIPAAPISPPPPPSPWATTGHLPASSVPGVGHLQILRCPEAGHLPTPGYSRVFDTQNINLQRILLEKKQIGSSVKDRGL